MSVRIPFPNATVTAVDKKLRFLVTGNFPGTPDRFLLGLVYGRGALTACRLDGSSFRMRHDMLIVFGH
jgi:hypothetical protein